jgi:pimeloyl-ACP methyl ester carboxylesterase
MTIIFIPGLSADERMFHSIKNELKNSYVLNWIEPNSKELLSSYVKRLKQKLPPDENYFVVGVSFGGIVALELTKQINSIGCLLVGSITSLKGLSFSKRQLLKLFRMDSQKIIVSSKFMYRRFGSFSPNHIRSKTRRFTGGKAPFYAWAYGALSNWEPPETKVPVYHIHGTDDEVFPIGLATPTKVIEGGGHNIMHSHPQVIGQYIKKIIKA